MHLPGALCLAIPAFRTGAIYATVVLSLHGGRSVLTFFPFHIGPVIENNHETSSTGFSFVELPGGLRRQRVGRFPERGLPHPHVNWLAER